MFCVSYVYGDNSDLFKIIFLWNGERFYPPLYLKLILIVTILIGIVIFYHLLGLALIMLDKQMTDGYFLSYKIVVC